MSTNISAAQDPFPIDPIGDVVAAAAPYQEAFADVADHDLVRRAQEGEEAATLVLIARHAARLRRCVRRAAMDLAPLSDLQQAAIVAMLEALRTYTYSGHSFFTYAWGRVREELREINRQYDQKPAPDPIQKRYWAAMRASDGDPQVARRWSELQRLSVTELEPIAEAGDVLAREIIDRRYDRWEEEVRRSPDAARTYEEMAETRGRGLEPAVFDMIHAGVTYLDDEVRATRPREYAYSYHDVIVAPDARDAHAEAEDRMVLARLMLELPEREREVLLAHLEGRTDAQIAQSLGVTRPRVVQIRMSATRRMRRTYEQQAA